MFYFALIVLQIVVTTIIGVYFFRQVRKQREGEAPVRRDNASNELTRLTRMRDIHLTEPLTETLRPGTMAEIKGQDEGIRALVTLLSGEHPQHVLIYGPPGVGKTCAARLALACAKRSVGTPFRPDAPFIEVDATCVRFDERSIADPLMGCVHDPIYQGAGTLGINGIPQPKEGAVTRAHGGVLFLDEIGELHPMQMHKLLKVLEDRKVRLDSAYYDPDDHRTPRYIHEIFQHGLPADFRLIGATTRAPEELPAALRSRCMEVFFKPLELDHLEGIAARAAERLACALDPADARYIARHSASGRDAVNIVQMACGLARERNDGAIRTQDVEWVIESGHYAMRAEQTARMSARPGVVYALAVGESHAGTVLPIEVVASPGSGKLTVTGIVEQEELRANSAQVLRRTSMARASAENAWTVVRGLVGDRCMDVHVNFPGGAPVDGPSAGVAMAVAMYSALENRPVSADIAMTGEISLQGRVLPVGGVPSKIEAAKKAGMRVVLIPEANRQKRFDTAGVSVVTVAQLRDAIAIALGDTSGARTENTGLGALAAEPISG